MAVDLAASITIEDRSETSKPCSVLEHELRWPRAVDMPRCIGSVRDYMTC